MAENNDDDVINALQTALVGPVTSVFFNMSKSDKKRKEASSRNSERDLGDTSDEDGSSMEDFVSNPRPLRKRYN